MGLGINYAPSEGGDFLPIVKYDARAGRFARVDRANVGGQWSTETVDITSAFKAVLDLENVEVGWINFPPGAAPDMRMVPLGTDPGPQPSDKHKMGFRVMLKLAKDAGGDVREWCSSAKACIGAVDELHNAFEAAGKGGQLPVIALKTTKAVTSGSGAQKSTNYVPVFEVTSWVKRPDDLVFRAKGAPAPKTNGAGPAATGSTKVSAPAQENAAEDFG